MARLLFAFIIAIGLTLFVAGGVYAWKNPQLLASKFPQLQSLFKLKKNDANTEVSTEELAQAEPELEQEDDGSVLGVSKENIEKTKNVLANVGHVVNPVVQQVAQVLGQTTTSTHVSSGSGTIDVNQAFENAKSQAAQIPEKVFDQARYTYCKQVVEEFEKR